MARPLQVHTRSRDYVVTAVADHTFHMGCNSTAYHLLSRVVPLSIEFLIFGVATRKKGHQYVGNRGKKIVTGATQAFYRTPRSRDGSVSCGKASEDRNGHHH